VIQAKEMALEMELNNLTRAELARKLGISRARVTQMLNLLKLPEELREEIERMGITWEEDFSRKECCAGMLIAERNLDESI